MRHRVKGRKLSRTASHRKATMRALTTALVKAPDHRITTTVAKAKELRRFIEPLITRAKVDNHQNRRMVFSALQEKHTVTRLFDEIGPKAADRDGGYTRVIKIGFRQGDGAEMAIIELVDYHDIKPEGGKTTKKKRTRRAGKSSAPKQTEAPAPVVEDTVAETEESVEETAPEAVVEEEVEAATESEVSAEAEESDEEEKSEN